MPRSAAPARNIEALPILRPADEVPISHVSSSITSPLLAARDGVGGRESFVMEEEAAEGDVVGIVMSYGRLEQATGELQIHGDLGVFLQHWGFSLAGIDLLLLVLLGVLH